MQSFASIVYNHLPIYFQNLYMGIENKKVKKERYGQVYADLLSDLAAGVSDNSGEEAQWEGFRKLLEYSMEHSPFYQNLYKNIDLETVQTLSDLPKLPMLEKEVLHEFINEMHAVEDSEAAVFHVIDREGVPLKFLLTNEDIQKRNAFMDFYEQQHGAFSRELKQAIFTAREIVPKTQQRKVYWRDNRREKIRLYSNYHCTQENAELYIQNLNEFQPAFINGTSPIIYKLAVWLNGAQEKLAYTPQAVFLQGGLMDPTQKNEIEKAFDCPVRHHFLPSYEFPMMFECTKGKLHAHPRAGIIELAEDGEMIATNFMSYGTPIIRFRTGIYAEMNHRKANCLCKSAQPIIEFRKELTSNHLRTADNAKVEVPQLDETGIGFSESVKKVQFVQYKKEAIDVFIEAKETYTNELSETIHDNLQAAFSQDMKFNIRVVEEMPADKAQNFQLIVSRLAN